MMLKVLILCMICIVSTNAILPVLMGIDLVLSLVSSGTDIAVNIQTLMSHNHPSIKDYSSDFARITNTLEEIKNEVYKLPKTTSYLTNLQKRTVDIAKNAKNIKDMSSDLPTYFDKKYQNETLRRNVEQLQRDVKENIYNYHTELVGIGDLSYLNKLIESLQFGPYCSTNSRHTYFYEFLKSYVASEVQASHVLINCLKMREYLENTKLDHEIENEKQRFKNRTQEVTEKFKPILEKSSLFLSTCNSQGDYNIVTDSEYTYFLALFPKLLLPSYDLDETLSCPNNNTKGIETFDGENYWSIRQCSNAVNCKRAQFEAIVCAEPRDKERRYTAIKEYEYEKKPSCKKGALKLNCELDDKFTILVCSELCDCICDDHDYDKSERHISLEEVTSNTRSNRVIVGVRFRKRNKVLSIDIQEAELIPNAQIRSKTLSWRSIKKEKPNNNPKEFHRLSWFGNRGIMLDFHDVPSKYHCVTGVRFRVVEINSENIVVLDIRVSRFKYNTGKLVPDTDQWIVQDYEKIQSQAYNIADRDVPTRAKYPLRQNHGPATVVNFTPSGYFTEDAGQSTLPYIDLQEIQTSSPLAGLGMFLADSTDSGGFLKLAVNEFNRVQFLP